MSTPTRSSSQVSVTKPKTDGVPHTAPRALYFWASRLLDCHERSPPQAQMCGLLGVMILPSGSDILVEDRAALLLLLLARSLQVFGCTLLVTKDVDTLQT